MAAFGQFQPVHLAVPADVQRLHRLSACCAPPPGRSISGLDADGEEYTLDAPDPAKLPEEELLAREEREELRAAMDLLAPEQRLILSLRVENDLSYTDIAAVLGVREGTVKSRLARARDQLRKKLSQSGNKAAAASSNPQKGGRGHEL